MLSAVECAKRASDCLKAAEACSDAKGRRVWQQLADAWITWTETVVRLNKAQRGALPSTLYSSDGHVRSLDYNRTSGPTEQRPAAALGQILTLPGSRSSPLFGSIPQSSGLLRIPPRQYFAGGCFSKNWYVPTVDLMKQRVEFDLWYIIGEPLKAARNFCI
jgi:hypothetical protein